MTALALADALAGLRDIPRFFIYRLTWDEKHQKYQKVPCVHPTVYYPISPGEPGNWLTFAEATRRLTEWRTQGTFALGWWFAKDCGYWFYDLDGHLQQGQYSPTALAAYAALPGCFMEVSSSGAGLHFIGRDLLGPHGCRGALHTELYTEHRGICFGLTGLAYGSADVSGGAGIRDIAAVSFPPSTHGEGGEYLGPRTDWRGPTDDTELLALARKSVSTAARFGVATRATFAQLWDGDETVLAGFYGSGEVGEGRTERDAALAQHLAFWTGCDAPRMERLMRISGLVREKWDTHRTYLRQLTIERACAKQREVFKSRDTLASDLYLSTPTVGMLALPPLALPPVVSDLYLLPVALPALALPVPGMPPLPPVAEPTEVVPVTLISDAQSKAVEQALDLAASASTPTDMHNRVIPAIRSMAIPGALISRVRNAVNKQLGTWEAKLTAAEMRALLPGSVTMAGDDDIVQSGRPAWVDDYVYLALPNAFLEIPTGAVYEGISLHRKLARMPDVPLGPSGMKMNVADLMCEHWNVQQAHDTFYHALYGSNYMYDGKLWWNSYNPATVPATATQYTADTSKAIELFMAHLYRVCGKRQEVFMTMMHWIAHQIQKPGHKVRWAPLLVGFEGSGKSVIGKLLTVTMGRPNITIVDVATISNSGGFTDWGKARAVTMFEEIYLTGSKRFEILNAVKQFLSNDEVTLNKKGDKGETIPNGTNYIAFTNHHDGLPLNENERKWMVVITPFPDIGALVRDAGAADDEAYFDPMFDSLDAHPGEWRKFFVDWQIPADFPPQRAPMTVDKAMMASSGRDEIEIEVAGVITAGCAGVTSEVFSSRCLTAALTQRNIKLQTNSAHYLFTRMGFVSMGQIFWNGSTHRVWAKPGISGDLTGLRMLLDVSNSAYQQGHIPNG